MIITVSFEVDIRFVEDEVWQRCVNNTDDWRGMFYPLLTKDDVVKHIAYNYIANGIDKINRLEGWGDLKGDEVEYTTIDSWQVVDD